jgi:AraC family transcriptional regulator
MFIETIRPHSARYGSRVRGLNERQLELVYGTIEEKIGEPITVSMLSAAAGFSRSYFSHAFRRRVGRTPHEYIMRLRVDRAMTLMADAEASLSQIALATGFCDQAHFANTFRRTTGATPTEWRRAHAC